MRHFQGSAWVLVCFWRGNCYWRPSLSLSLFLCVYVLFLKNWSKVDLQYCVSFRHIAKWFSDTDMFCVFPAKSRRDAQWSGSRLLRGQVNMVNETKVPGPVHSAFETLVVRPAVRCCCGEGLGPSCWPVPAAGVAVFGASHQFAEQMSWFLWD